MMATIPDDYILMHFANKQTYIKFYCSFHEKWTHFLD